MNIIKFKKYSVFHSICWLGKSRYKHTCTLSRSTHVNIVSDEVLSFENCVQLEWFNQKKGQNQRKWEDGYSTASTNDFCCFQANLQVVF
jgi:hypothetical protein